MDAAWSTVLGGVVAAGAGAVVAAVNARWARMQAREQREHDRHERRYADLREALVRFVRAMDQIVTKAEHYLVESHGTLPDSYDPLAPERDTRAARDALAELELFADAELYQAGRAWVDAYLAHFWHLGRGEHSRDHAAARERVVALGQRALGVAG